MDMLYASMPQSNRRERVWLWLGFQEAETDELMRLMKEMDTKLKGDLSSMFEVCIFR